MFRPGRVSSTDAARHTAQVVFAEDGEDGDFVSYALPVLVTRPGDYSLPEKDSLVLCAMQPGADGVGWVLGAFYSDADAPPDDDQAVRVVRGDDLRLGSVSASDHVALAPATKGEIEKVLDYAKGISNALSAAGPAGIDPSAPLWAPVVVALAANVAPTIDEPAAEKVKAL